MEKIQIASVRKEQDPLCLEMVWKLEVSRAVVESRIEEAHWSAAVKRERIVSLTLAMVSRRGSLFFPLTKPLNISSWTCDCFVLLSAHW